MSVTPQAAQALVMLLPVAPAPLAASNTPVAAAADASWMDALLRFYVGVLDKGLLLPTKWVHTW